jgi:putative aminopeptidase FrvX
LLPSLLQAIAIEPRQHSYVFIGFTEEEVGLIGSRFHARAMTPEQLAATDAMTCLLVALTSKDKLAAVRLDDYYNTYRLLAVYLVFLDHYFDTP